MKELQMASRFACVVLIRELGFGIQYSDFKKHHLAPIYKNNHIEYFPDLSSFQTKDSKRWMERGEIPLILSMIRLIFWMHPSQCNLIFKTTIFTAGGACFFYFFRQPPPKKRQAYQIRHHSFFFPAAWDGTNELRNWIPWKIREEERVNTTKLSDISGGHFGNVQQN